MTGDNLIYKAASMYFEDSLTQQQIANRLGISRIKVSRILQQARARGIVEIRLKKPRHSFLEEEKFLAEKLKLFEVILSDSGDDSKEDQLASLGEAASRYAMRIITGNEKIGLTWGSTLSSFMQKLPKVDMPGLRIVQMIGGLGSPEAEIHGSDLVRRFSDKTGGIGRMLSAPGVVSSGEVKKGLLEDPYIKETLLMAASVDIAFVGIGTASPDSILMRKGKILTPDIVKGLKDKGAVGDISLRFFNAEGYLLEHPINERIVGLTAEEIRGIPRVVAVAGGSDKFEAIKGALKSNLIDVLITDYETGKKLMEE